MKSAILAKKLRSLEPIYIIDLDGVNPMMLTEVERKILSNIHHVYVLDGKYKGVYPINDSNRETA